jgi:hypothetical protein
MAKSTKSSGTGPKKPKREPPLEEPVFCLWIEVSEEEGRSMALGYVPEAVAKQLVAWGKWVEQWQALPTIE